MSGASQHDDKVSEAMVETTGPGERCKVDWWRNTYKETAVIGAASFLGPGMYAALAATGGGGLADVDIGNAATACAYALMVPSCIVANQFLSKFNVKISLALGASGYAFYSAALYTNSKYGNQWFLILGAVICGLTSGIFWVTEGAAVMNYAEPHKKGRLLGVWQSIYVLATLVGGAINLGLNINGNKAGGLTPNTYAIFVALSCLAPLAALLLSNPQKVQRTDGKPVPKMPSGGWREEAWLTLKELGDPRILACAFLWSQSLFIPSYFTTYRAKYFSVRVRGLSSVVVPVISVIWFQINGLILDSRMVLRKKLLLSWTIIQGKRLPVVLIACCIWQMICLLDIFHNRNNQKVTYDWTTKNWVAWWLPCIFGHSAQQLSYGYNYYMATFVFPKGADGVRVSRIISTLRSAESGSAAIAFGIAAVNIPLYKLGIINLVFLGVVLALGAYLHIWIWINDKNGVIDDGRGSPETPESVDVNVVPKTK